MTRTFTDIFPVFLPSPLYQGYLSSLFPNCIQKPVKSVCFSWGVRLKKRPIQLVNQNFMLFSLYLKQIQVEVPSSRSKQCNLTTKSMCIISSQSYLHTDVWSFSYFPPNFKFKQNKNILWFNFQPKFYHTKTKIKMEPNSRRNRLI